MLKIRSQQMKVFEQEALRNFEDEMVAHSQIFSSKLCGVIGEPQLRAALRQTISQAETYNFTRRGPLRFYIEMMFLYGSGFDTDPQHPNFSEALNTGGSDMERADQLYECVVSYQREVAGPGNINVLKALKALSVIAQHRTIFTENNFLDDIYERLATAFPQKVDYTPNDALFKLIQDGRDKARGHGFHSSRSQAMIVILMFTFGHQCTNDFLYPWISRTLKDSRIVDAAARAARLERKSKTWLSAVLAHHKENTV